jgi:eukaryotic-like serine/threonine-protein kinase
VLSGDGHALAFSDEGVLGGANYTVIFRKMDGSPPISLGEGWPLAVSTNGGLVFIAVDLTPERLLLAPTGPGATQRIDHGQFASATSAGGLQVVGRDTIMLFCAAEPSQSTRCYVQAGVSGTPRAVTPNGSSEAVLSPDAMRVIATVGDSAMLFSANGSAPPQVVRGFRSTDRLLRWSPDGRQLWVVATPETEVARIGIDAIDLGTGSRRELETIVPRDLGGVRDLAFVQLADDPRVYAYTKFTYTSRLFSVEGLKE